ncbi:hypothetical protein HMPREF9444_00647 [Succinatimonas hippei YIT 12066]|uniref:Uncharacterized protein n=1 Tax=Succinatimonas hippei (strain DSM 22608 / JCM 16073 / KCTC 15190 / YIT 12066) TaxID=762983 RepID=E8LIX5_SUCHY|nr:hypothetical protein HMPREF9444_00647 [Succinatimonas hippei YIT 12066]
MKNLFKDIVRWNFKNNRVEKSINLINNKKILFSKEVIKSALYAV